MRAAKGVPDPADAGEIKLALEVAPARQNLRGHRIEHRLEADAVAGVELVAAWRNMHAHPARLIAHLDTGEWIGVDHDAPALLHQIDVDNPSRDGEWPEVPLQHRRLALPGGLPHERKAAGKDSECDRRFPPHAMLTHCDHRAESRNCRRDAMPQGRPDFKATANADPGAQT